jgi:hypothetical protein
MSTGFEPSIGPQLHKVCDCGLQLERPAGTSGLEWSCQHLAGVVVEVVTRTQQKIPFPRFLKASRLYVRNLTEFLRGGSYQTRYPSETRDSRIGLVSLPQRFDPEVLFILTSSMPSYEKPSPLRLA